MGYRVIYTFQTIAQNRHMRSFSRAFNPLHLGLGLFWAVSAWGGTVSPQLAAMAPNAQVQVIVQHNPSLLGGVLSSVCGTLNLIQLLPLGELCSVTVADAMNMAQNPSVAHVSVNNTLQGTGSALPVYDYTPQTIQPTYTNTGSANSKQGQSIGIAIIDSGIHVNQDLQGNGSGSLLASLIPQVWYAQSFVPGEDADDYYGHGTHIAGIVAGNGANSSGALFFHDIHGIAPGAHLINLKVLDKNGQSTDAEVIQAIDRAIQLKNLFNIKVINISLGRPIYESYKTDPLCQEVEKAWLAGITVVVAAGNAGRDNSAGTQGYGTIAAPGNDPLAITVGAMNTESTPQRGDDLMTTYSSKGPTLADHVVKPDIVAPGNKIFSILDPGATLETTEPSDIVPLASYAQSPAAAQTSGIHTRSEQTVPKNKARSSRLTLPIPLPVFAFCVLKMRKYYTRLCSFPGSNPSHQLIDSRIKVVFRRLLA